jgi:cell division transport system permease protein
MSAVSQLRRSPYQTVGIYFALTFSFFILLLFSFTILLLTKLVAYVESQPQVTVYFLKTTPESDIFKLRQEILETGKVKEARYVSKDQALAIYKDINKNEPLLLEMVSKEALPASLEVYTTKPEYLRDIAQRAKEEPGVEDVAFQQDVIDNLIKITNGVKFGALAFLTAQFVVVFFVIFSTMTFKMIAKKDEIETLRLLGASRFFIARPLISENMIINFAASLTASIIFVGGYFALQQPLFEFLVGIPTLKLFEYGGITFSVWPPNMYLFALMTALTFGVGYLLIWLTTYLAANKYIK